MKKIIGLFIAVTVVAVALISSGVIDFGSESKCEEYEEILSGQSYIGYDNTTTVSHGKVDYNYILDLNEDKSCTIHFKAVRYGDTGTFSKNGTFEFDVTGMTWNVQYNGNSYEVLISGDWDWQDWSAAEIDRSIVIGQTEENELILDAVRSGYYDFQFKKYSRPLSDSVMHD